MLTSSPHLPLRQLAPPLEGKERNKLTSQASSRQISGSTFRGEEKAAVTIRLNATSAERQIKFTDQTLTVSVETFEESR